MTSFRIKFNDHYLYGFEDVRASYVVEKRAWKLEAGGSEFHIPHTELLAPSFDEAVERFAVKLASVRARRYCPDCKHPAIDLIEFSKGYSNFDPDDPPPHLLNNWRMSYQCWHGGWEGGEVHQCNSRPLIATL